MNVQILYDNTFLQAWTAKYTNVRINIPPLSVQKDELSITGEKDGVLAVKAAIVAIWKDMEKKCSTIQVRMSFRQGHFAMLLKRFYPVAKYCSVNMTLL